MMKRSLKKIAGFGGGYRRISHVTYSPCMGSYPTNAPARRPSLSKAWPTIPLKYVPASILQDSKINTYRLVLLLFGHVVGHWQGFCLMSAVGETLSPCIIHSSPFIRRMACAPSVGDFRMMRSGQISTTQWKSVIFPGIAPRGPNLHVHITCLTDLAVSMCACRVDRRHARCWSIFCAFYTCRMLRYRKKIFLVSACTRTTFFIKTISRTSAVSSTNLGQHSSSSQAALLVLGIYYNIWVSFY